MVEEIMFSGTHAHGVELVATTKRNLSAHLRPYGSAKLRPARNKSLPLLFLPFEIAHHFKFVLSQTLSLIKHYYTKTICSNTSIFLEAGQTITHTYKKTTGTIAADPL